MTLHTRHTIETEDSPLDFVAAYLRVAGDECAFIETATAHAQPKLLHALAAAGRKPEDVRWVIITHAHLDHAAGASALMSVLPRATLLAHPRAARHMVDPAKLVKGATAVYGAARFAELYGTIEPIAAERVRALEDGESVDLGDGKLTVHHTAGHANHHFVVDDPKTECVYTGDSFGLVYPALQAHGRFALASTSPSNFDAAEARLSIARILGLGEREACLTHFGAFSDLNVIAAQVEGWVDRAEAWVDEAARGDESLEQMSARIKMTWRDAIARDVEARHLGFGEREWKTLELDIELNAQGLAVVAELRRNPPPPRVKTS